MTLPRSSIVSAGAESGEAERSPRNGFGGRFRPSTDIVTAWLCLAFYLLLSALVLAGIITALVLLLRNPDESSSGSQNHISRTATVAVKNLQGDGATRTPTHAHEAGGGKGGRSSSPVALLASVEASVAEADGRMEAALRDVVRHLKSHPASPTSAILEDCAHMLDHGLHSLRKALPQLSSRIRLRHQPKGKLRRVRGLLSAAMTNQDSCLGGFGEDLGQGEAHKLRRQSRDLEKQLREGLGPILRLLSKSLTILKEIETKNSKTSRRPHLVGPRTRITRRRSGSSRSRHSHMRSLIGLARPLPDAIVDGMSTVTSPNITTLSPHTFRTISEAVEAAPANSRRRHVIWIRAGTYHENVVIPSNKTHLLLVGEGMDKTVISGNRSVSVARCTTYASATLAVSGDSFAARDLTVENTAGPMAGQAVALRVSADCAAFYRCGILGHQDTLYAHSLSQFYRDCVVRGTVDFIFGNAAAVFQGCRVEALKPVLGQWNMVTAQGRADPGEPTGFALHNCTVVAAGAGGEGSRRDGDTYLGRPWRSHARTMVMGSYLGGVVHPEGWHEWTEPRALAGVRLMEYRNSGPGADTSRRVKWARVNVTAEEAREFAIGELIGGRWLNSTAYPFRYGI